MPLGNLNNLIGQSSGLQIGARQRKLTSENTNLLDPKDLKNLAIDLNSLCTKEYTRRLSGNIFNQKEQVEN
jgi:hypothetical protein